MDCMKIGKLLFELRTQKGMTQAQVADALGVSNKTVSKWECGMGCPDLPLWSTLSEIFGVDIIQLMDGEIEQNAPDSGNLKKMKFFVCPHCGNVLTATGNAAIFCCGRKLEAEAVQKDGMPDILVEESDGEYYVTIDHPMEKDHFITCIAAVSDNALQLVKTFPEGNAEARFRPQRIRWIYAYCNRHGLFRIDTKGVLR